MNEKGNDDKGFCNDMLTMFYELDTLAALKHKEAFPDAGNHALDPLLFPKL